MKRVGHLILLAMLALGTVARAQEEDDDPKSKPPVAAKARAVDKAKPKAEPKAEPKTPPKADVEPKAKAEPVKKTPVEKAESKSEVRVEKIADEPAKKNKVKALPKLARAPEAAIDVMTAPETQAAPRSVRVRLVDGSTVVGSVRAEQVDALVVDCSLGQLSIPRSRISTISYDAAAGVGAKRAPVQQLDDDAPPAPKRRAVTP